MTGIEGTLQVAKDVNALIARAVEIIGAHMQGCATPFRLCLSADAISIAVYRTLSSKSSLPWACVEIFQANEHFVPADDPCSRYGKIRDALLTQIEPRKVLAISSDDTPQSAASRYDEVLRQQYGAGELITEVPLFDLTILGLGDDGHTASLLPDHPVLDEQKLWVAPVVQENASPQLTLTYPALNASRTILFLVNGAGKRDALAQARGGGLPAGALKPLGEVIWLVDAAAAGVDDEGYGF